MIAFVVEVALVPFLVSIGNAPTPTCMQASEPHQSEQRDTWLAIPSPQARVASVSLIDLA